MSGNAAIVRRGYRTLNEGDLMALTGLLHNDIWHTPGRGPLAGDVVGLAVVFARLGRYRAETGGTFRTVLERLLIDEDGRVIGIHRSGAERAGRRLDVYRCTVFELENGHIADGREHIFDLQAWDEFWS